MNTEIEIINTIIQHYTDLFEQLCHKNRELVQKLEELSNTTTSLGKRTEEIDKPLKELKSRLEDKRKKKLNNIKTHTQRGTSYVAKRKNLNHPEQTNLHNAKKSTTSIHQLLSIMTGF